MQMEYQLRELTRADAIRALCDVSGGRGKEVIISYALRKGELPEERVVRSDGHNYLVNAPVVVLG